MKWSWLAPHYWPTWIGMGLMRLLAALPYRVSYRIGLGLGALMRQLPLRHNTVARVNIQLCLPEFDARQREILLARHSDSLGIAICETALAWYATDAKLRSLAQIHGAENLRAALAAGNGVILLASHFTTLEIGARFCALHWPLNIVYRPSNNALLGEFQGRCRDRLARRAIRRDDIRSMVAALKANEIVWFAPDQSYRKKGAQMVPFFGIAAATNPATSRLARMTGAAVLPYFVERLPQGAGYVVRIDAALQNFPSTDTAADALRVHHLIEAHVRRVPEQYLWIHRRFKGTTPDYPDYYAPDRFAPD